MRKLIFIYPAILILLLAGFFFDEQIARIIAGSRISFLDDFMIWISYGGTWFVVLIVMTSLFLWNERKRKWIFPLWASLAASAVITYGLKFLFFRERPFEVLDLPALVDAHRSSFPSGHATAVFSTLAILDKEFPKFKWFWLGFAALVGFSRLYLGVHYLSDVVVGGAIGFSVSILMVHFWEKKFKK